MNRTAILIIIGLSIIIFMFLQALVKAKRIIKKGKKVKAKVIKKEREECESADINDPMKHWFNLEVEVNNKIYKRGVAITNYTKELKIGDDIDIILYKEDFLLEAELGDYNKCKN